MKSSAITSVTYILVGNMLITYNSIGEGWTAAITTIFGYILFFIGLNRLKSFLDTIGQDGVSKLVWAAILGIIATFFSFIPLIGGIPAGLLNIIAFILHLIGLLKLKKSEKLGETGASGISYLLIAISIMVFASFLGILPFVGGVIKSAISIVAFMLIPFGWFKVQEAIIENSAELNVQVAKIENLAFCTSCGKKIEDSGTQFCENCGTKL